MFHVKGDNFEEFEQKKLEEFKLYCQKNQKKIPDTDQEVLRFM